MVKTTGDGAHAAFATAHDAIGAAVDAQRSLEHEAWHLAEPIRVRIGLHTGYAPTNAKAITTVPRSIAPLA